MAEVAVRLEVIPVYPFPDELAAERAAAQAAQAAAELARDESVAASEGITDVRDEALAAAVAAADSADAADASKVAAAASEGSASGYAGTAATSAGQAMTSANAAGASEDAAAASAQEAADLVATISPMDGATEVDPGSGGTVPAPAAGDQDKVLSGAGTYIDVFGLTPEIEVGSAYAPVLADAFTKLKQLSDGTGVALTLPDLPAGTIITFQQHGAGAITVDVDAGLTKWHPGQTNVTIGQGAFVFAVKDSATNWTISGGLAPAESWSDAAVYATDTTPGVLEIATQPEVDAGTDNTRAVTPAGLKAFKGVADAWVRFSVAGDIDYSYGVSSIVDDGVGEATINLTTPLATAGAIFHIDIFHATLPRKAQIETPSTTAPSVRCYDGASTLADPTRWYFSAWA